MAIEYTNRQTGEVKREFVGRVLKVDHFKATRNVSDTLDYSDYQTVDCTQATVYVGRRVAEAREHLMWIGAQRYQPGEEIPLALRFTTVDCSNLFAWRGADLCTATVDADPNEDAEMAEDLAAYEAEMVRALEEQELAAAARYAAEKKAHEEAQKNAPVKGKKMVVYKGRKVPLGTVGIVAYVSGSGSVLLKDEACWQDRKADGVWVNAGNLRAV